MKKELVIILSAVSAFCAEDSIFAASVSYNLNGSSPYYWETVGNWSGEAQPTSGDAVTINQTGLKTSPLTIQSGTSASVSSLVGNDMTLVISSGASLSASGNMQFAQTASKVSVVTNYGTVSANLLDVGAGGQKTTARFDNFGTLTVKDTLRIQNGSGGASILHNHEGATITKNAGNDYSFYINNWAGSAKVINDGTFIDNTTGIIKLGMSNAQYGKGEIILNKSGLWRSKGILAAAFQNDGVGVMTMNDSSKAVFTTGEVRVGVGERANGQILVNDDAEFVASNVVKVGWRGVANTKGLVSLKGRSRMRVEGTGLQIGFGAGATGCVSVAENAILDAKTITLCPQANSAKGVLVVADSGVVSNVNQLTVGQDRTDALAAVVMRGGTILCNGNNANPIILNSRVSRTAKITGWGKVAFLDPIAAVRDASDPRGIQHYGRVIADGEGVLHDLDFSRFGALNFNSTDVNPHGTNGWFAVNKGRLKLPRSLPTASGRKCVGDKWDANVDAQSPYRRLSNTFNYTFTGATLGNYVFSELYATDRDDIPAGLDTIGAHKVIAVWRIGHFSDGPDVDEPTHPASFTTANLKFKYSPDGLDGINYAYVYRHDGTVNGKWTRCSKSVGVNTAMPIISTTSFAPSSANWNAGWFAIVGRKYQFGTTIIVF